MRVHVLLCSLVLTACAVGDVTDLGALGEPCGGDPDCATGICVALYDGTQLCSEVCEGACPDGFLCQPTSDNAFCVPNPESNDLPEGGATLPSPCARGDLRACDCPDGTQGMQLCRADGLGWAGCTCEQAPLPDAGAPPVMGADAGAPPPSDEDAGMPQPPPEQPPNNPPPPPNPQDDLPEEGFLNCLGILACGNICSGVQICFDQCFQNGTFTGRAGYVNYARCANRAGCRTEEECQMACPTELQLCTLDFGRQAGCGGIFYCVQACFEQGEGVFCQDACETVGTAGGQQRYRALNDCLQRSGCRDSTACEQACGAPLDACFADP